MRDFLDKEERAVLIEAHRAEREKKLAYRINAILLLDEGYEYSEVSQILFLDNTTIRRYEKEYKDGGLDELLTDKYKGGG
ncbi:helix-turn-helix domain-containing protein [Candidatus Magnetobacterium casense]|uniref:Helix-turn-helix domain-containing protein n=1 Tax=Candidatus Magnetobacterium casense TaxID=1455061 RepID=A0ABS6RY84_9BACT|nr:helix-turn-helix domain-containing protein [Candidatus Magnetobacterium casensis]MBV6341607.1 helix-turn-helix domain-containing protein [Candidatus Magnetobacterium casensis]